MSEQSAAWKYSFGLLFVLMAMLLAFTAPASANSGDFVLAIKSHVGHANGEPLVIPDCKGSRLKIKPCGRVSRSWLKHLNSRVHAFADAYRAAGNQDAVVSATLHCGSGMYSPRKTRQGTRKSRHSYAEACDGNKISVNGKTFDYQRAVNEPKSSDRRFFVAFLDAWGTIGPGCMPDKNYTVLGVNVGCRPIVADNCGVIDWRERGKNTQYGKTYHLSYCIYTDPARAYE